MPLYVPTAIGSGFNKALFTTNFTDIQTALNSVLYRDGSGTNTMTASLDMNSERILNLISPTTDQEPATKKYVDDIAIAAGAVATWGEIVGTLSAQTDLQAALDLKAPLASPTFTGTFTTPGIVDSAAANVLTVTAAESFFNTRVSVGNSSLTTPLTFVLGAKSNTEPKIQFDTNDEMVYDRVADQYEWWLNTFQIMHLDSTTLVLDIVDLDLPFGGATIGAPTGGLKGDGTLNAEQLYIQGVLVATGTGDVVGPASSVNLNLPTFSGTTGKLIQDSGVTLPASAQAAGEQTGTSGNTLPFLDGSNTWSALQTFGSITSTGIDDTASTATQITITDAKVTFEDNVHWEETLLTTKGEAFLGATGATTPILNFDAGDRIIYDRTANDFDFQVGSTSFFQISAGGSIFGAPTGGFKGVDTLNVAGQLYVNNVAVATAGTAGDVVGPVSATDGNIAIYDGTTGKIIKDTFGTPGTAALKNTGTSGSNVPLLDAANTWTLSQTFSDDIVMASTKGLDFSANANAAGADSERLDDYERGTWTATLLDLSLNASEGQTYAVQEGRYIKVGDLCYIWMRLEMTSLGTLTAGDKVVIGGIPFQEAGRGVDSFMDHSGQMMYQLNTNVPGTGDIILGEVRKSGVVINMGIYDASTKQIATCLVSYISATGELGFSMCYDAA